MEILYRGGGNLSSRRNKKQQF